MSRYNFNGGQNTSHVTLSYKRTTGGVALPALQIGHGSRNKSKNHDELINFTGVVSKSVVNFLSTANIIKGTILFFFSCH